MNGDAGRMKKTRIDMLLVERGLAPTRAKAQALVMAGCVFVGGAKAAKPGHQVDGDADVEVQGQDHPYVGRGGVKLAHALDHFGVDVRGRVCMDVGASTGGFTDCLLQRGARRVYAVDVGYGQLAWKVAEDPRVVVLERTNIRALEPARVPEAIEIAVVDVSFISLAIVLVAVDPFLAPGAWAIALVKPQFEVGRGLVGKGGVVRDPAAQAMAVEKVQSAGREQGWECLGVVSSPLRGARGNAEFFLAFRKG